MTPVPKKRLSQTITNVNQTPNQTDDLKRDAINVGHTKSMPGFVLKAWKSSSFIDTNMLASIPRDVPMPCKIYSHAEQMIIALYKLGRACPAHCCDGCLGYLFIRLRKCIVAN